MTPFIGRYFDGRSSRGAPVAASLSRDGSLSIRGEEITLTFDPAGLRVSARLGSTPRLLRLPGGASLELEDSDALDAALHEAGVTSAAGRRAFTIERHWAAAFAALLVSAALLAFAVRDGVPALARLVAEWLPAGVEASLGEEILATLDGEIFHSSELAADVQARIDARFVALRDAAGAPRHATLAFRATPALGANAFALPSGRVIVTDQLVTLSASDDEVVAVLAHELGHVAHRHALRSVLQNVGIGVLVAGALGDFTSVSAAAGTLPVTLVQLQYSRRFEREADAAGAAYLDAIGVPRARLADMLERLAAEHGESSWSAYLSTHPATDERVATLRGVVSGEE